MGKTLNKIIKNIKLRSAGIVLASGIAALTLSGCHGNKEHDIKEFSIIDTLEIDTVDENPTMDHVYDYLVLNRRPVLKKYIKYKILKENIKFETTYREFTHQGSLHVRKEESSEYETINNPFISSEKIRERNYVVYKIYSLDKNLKINELFVHGAEFKEGKPFSELERTYTRGTDSGNKILDSEQVEVKKYLEKIAEYKKRKKLLKH